MCRYLPVDAAGMDGGTCLELAQALRTAVAPRRRAACVRLLGTPARIRAQ
jgi:hypothetical protein